MAVLSVGRIADSVSVMPKMVTVNEARSGTSNAFEPSDRPRTAYKSGPRLYP